MADPMEITILGAGAMGSLFGGLLAEAGHDVTLVDVDDAHLEKIRRDGLRLRTDAGERVVHELRVSRPEHATHAPELLIVFTKTMHTSAALASARALLGPHTVVLSLQNGLGNVERLTQFVARDRVMVGVTTWPADKAGAAQVSSHGAGVVRMMNADGAETVDLKRTVDALNSAGLHSTADPDVWAAISEKVAFNAALNSVCAVTRCTVGELANVPDGEALALNIVAEVAAVARANDVVVNDSLIVANVRYALAHHREHRPSMLQDVLGGRKTEIEAINGAVVAAAHAAGVAVPCTETLLHLVRLGDARVARTA